jgi:hypothetical protein
MAQVIVGMTRYVNKGPLPGLREATAFQTTKCWTP